MADDEAGAHGGPTKKQRKLGAFGFTYNREVDNDDDVNVGGLCDFKKSWFGDQAVGSHWEYDDLMSQRRKSFARK